MSRILVIDDHESMRSGVRVALERRGHEVVAVADGQTAMTHLEASRFDLILTDYKMAGMDGLAVLDYVQSHDADVDVMVMTAYGSVDLAVEAMKRGAVDYVSKPFSPDVIGLKVDKALSHREVRVSHDRLKDENTYLKTEIDQRFNFGEMVGSDPSMQQVYERVKKVAPIDSAVLVLGESGTGKELVARAIHQASPRKNAPFIKVNCGALPKDLVEGELFGHEKGAFTGAVKEKRGRFELADGGTLFLDEVGDLPLEAQVKILRVLQEKTFERVGGEKTIQVDVRIVAATNRSLKDMVTEGAFREDLYYRLYVIPVVLPPLRERKVDIPGLVEHFLHKKSSELGISGKSIADAALQVLIQYQWPGNVRELENLIERVLVLSDGDEISVSDLPFDVPERAQSYSAGHAEDAMLLNPRLDELERDMIVEALAQAKGVKTRAAEILGIKTSALYYKLDKYGLADS
ncbi:MAG: sigma-54 dependent transcriptional regulator [bacterium]|jgi:two-component system, NtrC family, response regulator HydG|nr:sigma-54 dependent transcriptional regulator [bacterium]